MSATNTITVPFLDSNDASRGEEVQEENKEDQIGHKNTMQILTGSPLGHAGWG